MVNNNNNKEFWIQLENQAWDLAPSSHVDRLTNEKFDHLPMTLISPITKNPRTRNMHKPLDEDALILRRYTKDWATPEDRKVNPWDVNEPDPTDNGTMGTIPGPVIECQVGDSVTVHFRNRDARDDKSIEERTHSLHPHGFVFEPTSDGSYPMSPPDPTQPIQQAEVAQWKAVGVEGWKKGDRVPPPLDPQNNPNDNGGSFTYTWNTNNWPSTAGVWIYHDHSICDSTNVSLGAIGIIVIHTEDPERDPDDVLINNQDLPGGSPIGSPIQLKCFPVSKKSPELPQPPEVPILPADVEGLGAARGLPPQLPDDRPGPDDFTVGPPDRTRLIQRDNLLLELRSDRKGVSRLCLPVYRTPPSKAQYLLLIHEMTDGLMCINGRQGLGNTPTLISGPQTTMRFGVAGMGNGMHTFHLHGHRWVISGPDGTDPAAIQTSPQVRAVSQFEDTRIFGPANSFAFTIQQDRGSFMGGPPPTETEPPTPRAFGEWHMHCHVLSHMMSGMMGSLLVVPGGNPVLPLPTGVACPAHKMDGGHGDHDTSTEITEIPITGYFFPAATTTAGRKVRWHNLHDDEHTIIWDTDGSPPNITTNIPAGGLSKPVSMPTTPREYNYHCGIHTNMKGRITVTG